METPIQTTDKKEFRKHLRKMRKALRGKYEVIADECKVSRMTVSRILRDKLKTETEYKKSVMAKATALYNELTAEK